MPLNPKSSVSENIKELHTGKTFAHTAAKFGKERADKQAVPIALNVARKAKKAAGGALSSPPWFVRSEARQMAHVGPLMSSVAGRTDHIPTRVPSGSYVVPADVVSGLGQGNTLAGMRVLGHMFSSGPYGSSMPPMGRARAPRMKFAGGGAADSAEPVDVMVAGGEYVISPDQVRTVGGGDLDHGHAVLDKWVVDTRKKINTEQRKLPGPAKD